METGRDKTYLYTHHPRKSRPLHLPQLPRPLQEQHHGADNLTPGAVDIEPLRQRISDVPGAAATAAVPAQVVDPATAEIGGAAVAVPELYAVHSVARRHRDPRQLVQQRTLFAAKGGQEKGAVLCLVPLRQGEGVIVDEGVSGRHVRVPLRAVPEAVRQGAGGELVLGHADPDDFEALFSKPMVSVSVGLHEVV